MMKGWCLRMIKCKKSKVTIKGSKTDIGADLVCLVRGLIDGDIMTPDEIKNCVDVGTMNDKEQEALFTNVMSSIFNGVFGEEDKDGK